MEVTLVATSAMHSILPDAENADAEKIIVYAARVSSNRTDLFGEMDKLLRYCIRNGHWSIFEQAEMTLRIETSRAIGRELLRHRSFVFQEFSQRYAQILKAEPVEQRLQAQTNRQSSTEEAPDLIQAHSRVAIYDAIYAYDNLIGEGVSRETARFVLPEATTTVIFMKGNVRSWITFLNVRLHQTAQKEMRDVAEEVTKIFARQFPVTTAALNGFKGAYDIHILDQLAVVNNLKKIDLIKEFWGIE